MTTDVLPELALGGATAVRRALDDPNRLAFGGGLRAVLREAALMLDFIVGYRAELEQTLRTRALDLPSLRHACDMSLEVLDTLLACAPLLSDAARRHGGPAELQAAAEEIARIERLARETRPAFAVWLDHVNRGAASVDVERFERGVAEAVRGDLLRYEGLDDMTRDLAGN